MFDSLRPEIPDAANNYQKDRKLEQFILSYFHSGRMASMGDLVDEHESMLSVGCGSGEMEEYIQDRIGTLYSLDFRRANVVETRQKINMPGVQGMVPPIPFADNSLDAVLAAGVTEHLPDEAGFIEDVSRVLTADGTLYISLPVEVGVGGLTRYLGRCYIAPETQEGPDGLARYVDYTLEELLKRTEREKYDDHRYYNYTYALDDLHDNFEEVTVKGWPVAHSTSLNLVLNVKATNPTA